MGYFGTYLSDEGKRKLPDYQYKGSDDSLVVFFFALVPVAASCAKLPSLP